MATYILVKDISPTPIVITNQNPPSTPSSPSGRPMFILVKDNNPVPQAITNPNQPLSPEMVSRVIKTGPRGAKGDTGQNAYELAVELGFTGTEQQWLDMQRGFLILDSPSDPLPSGILDRTIVWERV